MNFTDHDNKTLAIIKDSVPSDTYKDLMLIFERLQAGAYEVTQSVSEIITEMQAEDIDIDEEMRERAQDYADGMRETYD